VKKLIEPKDDICLIETALHIDNFHLTSRFRQGWRLIVGGFEPEGLWVKTEPSGFLSSGVSKLKTELDAILLLEMTGEEHVGISDGMKGPRTSEGRSDFVPRYGFFHVVYHNERSFGFVAQVQKGLAQGGHSPCIVFILVVCGVEGVQDDDLGLSLSCGVKEVFESF
jgi:hypothetical protein